MCIDFHPGLHPLLAVGLYDGSVRVYDVRKRENKPIYSSDAASGKHSDPVWEVKWVKDASSEPQFYSVSSDGRVASWTVTKSELRFEPLLSIKVLAAPPGDEPGGEVVKMAMAGRAAAAAAGGGDAGGGGGGGGGGSGEGAAADGAAVGSGIAAVAALRSEAGGGGGASEAKNVIGLAGGCCFAFSPFFPNVYLVGTEEGRIHKANLETAGQLSCTFGGGHHMAVYALRWSPWHPRVFLSCSADWTVKLWDDSHASNPIYSFDMGTSVGDVAWAPYSATVFAAVTDDGRITVWDVAKNKKEPLCGQKVRAGWPRARRFG